jgi:hypothetical protein
MKKKIVERSFGFSFSLFDSILMKNTNYENQQPCDVNYEIQTQSKCVRLDVFLRTIIRFLLDPYRCVVVRLP